MAALGPNAPGAMATMAHIDAANTILLIGNDPSQQNPLVAWQIRSAVRHHGAHLYSIQFEADQTAPAIGAIRGDREGRGAASGALAG